MLRLPAASLALLALLACGPDPAAAPTKAGPSADAEDGAPAAAPAAAGPKMVAPASAPAAVRGPSMNIRDPAWFRVDLFEGATLIKQGRSPAESDGLFASQITVALADGTTRDACVDHLREAVSADVTSLTSEEKDERVTLTGSNDNYAVTMICGEAKGKMTAYVSYRWTKLPSGA